MLERVENEIYLSLVIPAFNEEERIGENLVSVLNFLRSQTYRSEIIVVDDGSRDRTVEVATAIGRPDGLLRVVQNIKNLGKGGAVQAGMMTARGKYLFFSDADLSVPIDSLPTFLHQLQDRYDIVIGTRQSEGAKIIVRQPIYREIMGRIYTYLSNLVLGLQISDFTCGFKGFRKDAAQQLFARQRLKRWSFDSEILYLAKRQGYRILEVPVTWRNNEASKVRLWKDAIGSFVGLVRIRINDSLRAYR
jgi:dolichyl-phosphate beta-glucosyltransferase